MAVSNVTKEFNDILINVNRKFEIIHASWGSCSRQFEVKFRTQIPRDNEDFNTLCDEWVELFSEVTDTVWAKKISNTGPKIRFRKQYQCWTHGGKIIQKELLFDARKCKATLDIKVLTDNPQSRRKNKHIRLGLNVVVKINFFHLHPVDITQPFSFFVHNCEPQEQLPTPVIQANPRLPQLVAAMVQNGPNLSKKTAEKAEQSLIARLNNNMPNQIEQCQPVQNIDFYQGNIEHSTHLLPPSENLQMETVPNFSIQNLEMVKIESHQPAMQQCTQFIVTPQFDMTEHFLMCQPLVFDTSQIIPSTTQNLTSHFIPILPRIDNQNIQSGSML